MLGLLLGLPSRRLTGDYLAIVTLFFLQLFQTVTTNGDDVFGHNLTGGPNGILRVDPFHLFGHIARRRSTRACSRSRTTTSRSRCSRRVRRPAASSTTRARAARGGRCARTPLAAEIDGHAGQLAQADELRVRRRRRGAHRHALRGAERERVPADVLLHAADHRLHDGDPRRLRQHARRRARRADRRPAARDAPRSRPRGASCSTSRSSAVRSSRSVVSRTLGSSIACGTVAFGFVVHAIAGALHHSWIAGEHAGGISGAIATGSSSRRTSPAGCRRSSTSA